MSSPIALVLGCSSPVIFLICGKAGRYSPQYLFSSPLIKSVPRTIAARISCWACFSQTYPFSCLGASRSAQLAGVCLQSLEALHTGVSLITSRLCSHISKSFCCYAFLPCGVYDRSIHFLGPNHIYSGHSAIEKSGTSNRPRDKAFCSTPFLFHSVPMVLLPN